MSKKKAAGKIRQQTRTSGRRLGLKVASGEKVTTGSILVRQRGTTYQAGDGVKIAKDHSLFAMRPGVVSFGNKTGRKVVSIN